MYNVAVVGAGIVGLTTAFTIQETFRSAVSVTVFAEAFTPNTTGDVAAGVLSPYVWDKMSLDDVIKWATATKKFCHKLWSDGFADKAGLSLIPMLKATNSDKPLTVPELFKSTVACTRLTPEQLRHLNKSLRQNYKDAVQFITFTCEPSKMLPFLEEKIKTNGGIFKQKFINCFEELVDFDVIVNCTGVKAEKLAQDDRVHPIRGQVTRIYAPWQFYGILSGEGSNYVLPNQNAVILGGAEQEGDYDLNVRENEKQNILEFWFNLIPSLKTAPILKHNAGLRPGRDKVRVELEEKQYGNKSIKIIHNYGHCGNGVTLSIGCAEEVATLIATALNLNASKL